MIKFFRKIRQQLLTKNKFSAYLLYAIGEIILVVIGILIALQINNWNEIRKEKVIENNYLIRLLKDIEKDTVILKYSEGLSQTRIDQIELLNKAINNPSTAKQKPKSVIESIEKITWRSFLTLSKIVYDELLNSGKMSLIRSEELREKLAVYYNAADRWTKILELHSQRKFTDATAGLLSSSILKGIENTGSLEFEGDSSDLDIEIKGEEVVKIIKELSLNKKATKWLPQIYKYHVLAHRVIEGLRRQNEVIKKIIKKILDNYSL